MDEQELTDIVANLRALGEVDDVEAKRAEGGVPTSVRASISAFANSRGGVVLLGIDEDAGFGLVALADPAKLAADLASTLTEEFEPPVRAIISQLPLEGSVVVVAEIPMVAPQQQPCFYKPAGMPNGSWVRVGATNRRLSPYEVNLRIASRGQPRDDEVGVGGTTTDDLDRHAKDLFIARMRATRSVAFGGMSDKEILRTCGVTTTLDGSESLTLAGLLAMGRYPQQWFPQLNLTFIHFPDDAGASSGVRFLDSARIDGSIPSIVHEALAVILRNLSRRSVITGAGRVDVLEYPEIAIREAIVNALVHRDLSAQSHGTQVQVELYPSRLVVRNPGGLHGPVTLEGLLEGGVSSARNARLLRLLEDVPIPGEDRTVAENRGTGIRAMAQALRGAGMKLPEFSDEFSSFSVTFPNHTLIGDDTVGWIESLDQSGLTDTQVLALAQLRTGDVLDNPTYRRITGADSRVATAELQDLVGRELIEQRGERRWARYTMPAWIASARRRLPPGDRRAQILDSIGQEALSAKEIARRSGIPDKTVRHWLKRMRDEGSIRLAGPDAPQSNNTRYESTAPPPTKRQPTLFE